jgi:hypothetical protein
MNRKTPSTSIGQSYGTGQTHQGQADFVITKNQCEYAALTPLARPKTLRQSRRRGENVQWIRNWRKGEMNMTDG